MPQGWKMVKERVRKEDGRYLLYYRFVEEEGAGKCCRCGCEKAVAPDAKASDGRREDA